MNLPKDHITELFWKKQLGKPLLPEEEALWQQQLQQQEPPPDKWAALEEELLLHNQFEAEKPAVIEALKVAFAREFGYGMRDTEDAPEVNREAEIVMPPNWWRRYRVPIAAVLGGLALTATLYLYQQAQKGWIIPADALEAGRFMDKDKVTIQNMDGEMLALEAGREGWVMRQHALDISVEKGMLVYRRVAGQSAGSHKAYNIIHVPVGRQLTVLLEDGSTVILNAASSLGVYLAANDDTRPVALNGEAQLQVATNVERPFIVQVSDACVKALGTRFIVQAYKDQPAMKVYHLSGEIEVANKKEYLVVRKPAVVEVSDAHVTLAYNAQQGKELEQALLEATARSRGMFYFESNTLAEIVPELERWYGVKLTNPEILTLPAHFHIDSIPRASLIGDIIEDLKGPDLIDVHLTGKKLTISRKK